MEQEPDFGHERFIGKSADEIRQIINDDAERLAKAEVRLNDNDKILISENALNCTRTYMWFLGDGRVHYQTRQWVPDDFFKQTAHTRDMVATAPKIGSQNHWRPALAIPNGVLENLMDNGDGTKVSQSDPEYNKRLKRLGNDLDYRDLRTSEGTL